MRAGEACFVWLGTRGEDASLLAVDGALAGIICCDDSPWLAAQPPSVAVVSIERETGVRGLWSSQTLEQFGADQLLLGLERAVARCQGRVTVVPYRASPILENAFRGWGYPLRTLASPSATLVEQLDDKVIQRKLFSKWGIRTPKSEVVACADLETERHPNWFPAVIQRRRGSLGLGTREVGTPAALSHLPSDWLSDEDFLLSQRLDGPVINVHAIAGKRSGWISASSIQLVGIPECGGGDEPFLYCGNDFASAQLLPEWVRLEVRSLAGLIAIELGNLGFSGVFGVDLLWDTDRDTVVVLEINPRFQGSTSLLTSLELAEGIEPTITRHLRAFSEEEVACPSRAGTPRLSGAEVVLYARAPLTVGAAPESLPEGARCFPRLGTHVESGASLGRLRFAGPVLQEGFMALTAECLKLLLKARQAVGSA